jgi:hypothetical protein
MVMVKKRFIYNTLWKRDFKRKEKINVNIKICRKGKVEYTEIREFWLNNK